MCIEALWCYGNKIVIICSPPFSSLFLRPIASRLFLSECLPFSLPALKIDILSCIIRFVAACLISRTVLKIGSHACSNPSRLLLLVHSRSQMHSCLERCGGALIPKKPVHLTKHLGNFHMSWTVWKNRNSYAPRNNWFSLNLDN